MTSWWSTAVVLNLWVRTPLKAQMTLSQDSDPKIIRQHRYCTVVHNSSKLQFHSSHESGFLAGVHHHTRNRVKRSQHQVGWEALSYEDRLMGFSLKTEWHLVWGLSLINVSPLSYCCPFLTSSRVKPGLGKSLTQLWKPHKDYWERETALGLTGIPCPSFTQPETFITNSPVCFHKSPQDCSLYGYSYTVSIYVDVWKCMWMGFFKQIKGDGSGGKMLALQARWPEFSPQIL